MKTPLLIAALILGLMPRVTHAQGDDALLKTLNAVNQRSIEAWRNHDRAGFAAPFAPEMVYLSSDGIFKLSDILDGLMTCTVGEVSLRNQQVRSLSPTSAVLVSRQHQQVHCGDHDEPSELNNTLTFVKRDGEWRIVMRTDTQAAR
jgi:uncharacterized protein (TIGR02246 family)